MKTLNRNNYLSFFTPFYVKLYHNISLHTSRPHVVAVQHLALELGGHCAK